MTTELISAVQERYAALSSYADRGMIERHSAGHVERIAFLTYFARPNKFRFEWQTVFSWGIDVDGQRNVIFCDGERVGTQFGDQPPELERTAELAIAGADGLTLGAAHTILSLLMAKQLKLPLFYPFKCQLALETQSTRTLCLSERHDSSEVAVHIQPDTLMIERYFSCRMLELGLTSRQMNALSEENRAALESLGASAYQGHVVRSCTDCIYSAVELNPNIDDRLFALFLTART